jgi:hypothetical protein
MDVVDDLRVVDGKRKVETIKTCPLSLTCMRMVWVSQRHRQLNGDSMDLCQNVVDGLLYESPGIA